MKYPKRISLLLTVILCCVLTMQPKGHVVVIDAGHGGKDVGAPGLKSYEKNINLAVAKRVKSLLEGNKDIKVVLTRNDDRFLTLTERCDIANKANGDLFISIHVNSLPKKAKNRRTIKGVATYTLGLHKSEDNLEVAMRENSVIELEEDYTTKYMGFDPGSSESYIIFEISQSKHMDNSIKFASMVQNQFVTVANRYDKGVRQAGFWVLAHTAMPSVLIELDFICNPESEKFLASESGQNKMAKAIYNAIIEYYKGFKTTAGINHTPIPQQSVETIEETTVAQNEYYKIQFLSSNKKLPSKSKKFKGLTPVECRNEDGKFCYTYGKTLSLKEANTLLRKVKKLFNKAYIIKVKE